MHGAVLSTNGKGIRMSGTERMRALTSGQMASAATVAQLAAAAAGSTGYAGTDRSADERPALRHKDGLA